VWSTFARPLSFKSTLIVSILDRGSLIMSFPLNSWLKCLGKPNIMLLGADNLYRFRFVFLCQHKICTTIEEQASLDYSLRSQCHN
jgi:hypothetical protein